MIYRFFSKLKLPLSFLSIIVLIGFFVQAFIYPKANLSWIYNTAILIFAIEFLSIHSSGFASSLIGKDGVKKPSLLLFFFYLVFSVILAIIFNNFILPLFFVFSAVNKFLIADYVTVKKKYIAMTFIIFLGSIIITFISSAYIKELIPFSQEILDAKPVNASGLFVEVPQTVLFWGVIYFSAILIANLYLVFKSGFKS